jgi:hypothetical protein
MKRNSSAEEEVSFRSTVPGLAGIGDDGVSFSFALKLGPLQQKEIRPCPREKAGP